VDPIEIMRIEHECARLIKVYCNSIDQHDVERLLGVFAKDGVWQRPGNPPLKGHGEIRKFVESHGTDSVSAHYVTNIVVDVESGARASSNAYALVFRGAGRHEDCPLQLTLPRLVVRYRHQFIRENNRWLISRKETSWLFRRETD
jgi:ketosteroid isomerase-like protein